MSPTSCRSKTSRAKIVAREMRSEADVVNDRSVAGAVAAETTTTTSTTKTRTSTRYLSVQRSEVALAFPKREN